MEPNLRATGVSRAIWDHSVQCYLPHDTSEHTPPDWLSFHVECKIWRAFLIIGYNNDRRMYRNITLRRRHDVLAEDYNITM